MAILALLLALSSLSETPPSLQSARSKVQRLHRRPGMAAQPAEARCCAATAACAASGADPSGCSAWCRYTASHARWFYGDGCYAWRSLCPACYRIDAEMPYRLRSPWWDNDPARGGGRGRGRGRGTLSARAEQVEMIAECTHVHGPFLLYVLTRSASWTLLGVYGWETAEWCNNRWGLVDSFSWDDPLDDVGAGLVGMAWGAAYARAGRVPVLLPAGGGAGGWRATARLLAQGAVFAAASSLLMARAWHTGGPLGGSDNTHAPAFDGLFA